MAVFVSPVPSVVSVLEPPSDGSHGTPSTELEALLPTVGPEWVDLVLQAYDWVGDMHELSTALTQWHVASLATSGLENTALLRTIVAVDSRLTDIQRQTLAEIVGRGKKDPGFNERCSLLRGVQRLGSPTQALYDKVWSWSPFFEIPSISDDEDAGSEVDCNEDHPVVVDNDQSFKLMFDQVQERIKLLAAATDCLVCKFCANTDKLWVGRHDWQQDGSQKITINLLVHSSGSWEVSVPGFDANQSLAKLPSGQDLGSTLSEWDERLAWLTDIPICPGLRAAELEGTLHEGEEARVHLGVIHDPACMHAMELEKGRSKKLYGEHTVSLPCKTFLRSLIKRKHRKRVVAEPLVPAAHPKSRKVGGIRLPQRRRRDHW